MESKFFMIQLLIILLNALHKVTPEMEVKLVELEEISMEDWSGIMDKVIPIKLQSVWQMDFY